MAQWSAALGFQSELFGSPHMGRDIKPSRACWGLDVVPQWKVQVRSLHLLSALNEVNALLAGAGDGAAEPPLPIKHGQALSTAFDFEPTPGNSDAHKGSLSPQAGQAEAMYMWCLTCKFVGGNHCVCIDTLELAGVQLLATRGTPSRMRKLKQHRSMRIQRLGRDQCAVPKAVQLDHAKVSLCRGSAMGQQQRKQARLGLNGHASVIGSIADDDDDERSAHALPSI